MAIVERIKGICLKPKDEWQVIATESTSTADLLKSYALPLAAIGAVAGFIGASVLGVSIPFVGGTYRAPFVTGLIGAAVQLGLSLLSVYVLALIVDALAPKFGGEKNSAQALKVAVYSMTPGWIAGVLGIIPALGILALVAACYGVYLLYLGLPRLMKCPPDKAATYTVVVVVCAIVLSIIAGTVTGYFIGRGAVVGLPSGLH